ncbi:FtsK/SpoIIIE domain-containing protein [Actinoplanes philippinensis]|uniref:FtsK/SpoIIIE domain-containing protein n=1 Tax=Actinoplanes philippinensis TaxID=35752 RepID=UPI0033F586CA
MARRDNWRSAMTRMLHHHETARARLRALTADLAHQAGPGLDEAARRAAADRDRHHHAERLRRQHQAHEAVTALRHHLAACSPWQTAPWPALTADPPPPGRPATAPDLIRLGTTTVTDGQDAPFAIPLLAGRHLCIAESLREPRVTGLVQSTLTRMLATHPGTLRIAVHDPVGLGRLLTPFQPLVHRGVATLHPTITGILDEAEQFARRTFLQTPPDRTQLVIVIADLTAESDNDITRVRALARAGADGNVHLLIAGAPRGFLPAPPRPATTDDPCTNAVYLTDGWVHTYETGPLTEITYDPAPPATLTARLCDTLIQRSTRGLTDLLPDHPWQQSSRDELAAPIGSTTGGDDITVRFDDRTPHWLVGGRSGAGKTNLILTTLLSLCARYSPDELELYLLDFKEGVSFQEFAPTTPDRPWLPHARTVGIEADREYGLAVLRELHREMNRRADHMKRAGATTLAALRTARPTLRCPRTVAVIDEFQVLLAGNDAIARRAVDILEELARKGRSYGVHLLMASQTLAGIEALYTKNHSIFDQFAMRIALPGGSSILHQLNTAADTLTLGQAIINTQAGTTGANRTARIPHAAPADVTHHVARLWAARPATAAPPHIFQGFAEHHLDDEPAFHALTPAQSPPLLLLGRHIDVRATTATVPLPADPGRHLAVIGSWPNGAHILAAAVRALARQHEPGTTRFLLAPLATGTTTIATDLHTTLTTAGHTTHLVTTDQLTSTLTDLATFDGPRTYLTLLGADAANLGTDRTSRDALKTLAQQGPHHGIHLLGWWRLLGRMTQDIGPTAREDIGCLMALNVPTEDLRRHLGDFQLHYTPRRNRALLIDRHTPATALVVPFSSADHPTDEDDHR